MTTKTTYYFVSCSRCNWSLETKWYITPNAIVRCPAGHAARRRFVEGRISTRVSCEEKCQTAEGNTCKCACGGRAHGRLACA